MLVVVSVGVSVYLWPPKLRLSDYLPPGAPPPQLLITQPGLGRALNYSGVQGSPTLLARSPPLLKPAGTGSVTERMQAAG